LISRILSAGSTLRWRSQNRLVEAASLAATTV
jgi:hypothetical protein